MPEIDYEQRLDPSAEIALGLDEKAAKKEAARCLNCGLVCYYRTQYH
jgi:NADPH-dependent glutamate synthase beta subunit-like oxidoreductase